MESNFLDLAWKFYRILCDTGCINIRNHHFQPTYEEEDSDVDSEDEEAQGDQFQMRGKKFWILKNIGWKRIIPYSMRICILEISWIGSSKLNDFSKWWRVWRSVWLNSSVFSFLIKLVGFGLRFGGINSKNSRENSVYPLPPSPPKSVMSFTMLTSNHPNLQCQYFIF